LETNDPANVSTGTKHPTFSANHHTADIDKCKRNYNQKQQIQLSKKTTNIGELTKANDTKASFKARKQTRSIRQLLGTHNAILSWNSVAGTLYIIKLASLHL